MAPNKTLLRSLSVLLLPVSSFAAALSGADALLWSRLTEGLLERGTEIRAPSKFLPAFKAFVLVAGTQRRYATIDPASGQSAFLDSECDLEGDCEGKEVLFLLANREARLEAAFLLKNGSVEPMSVFAPEVRERFDARRRQWLDYAKGLPRELGAQAARSESFRELAASAAGKSAAPAVFSGPAAATRAGIAAAADILPVLKPGSAGWKISPPLRRGFKSMVSALLAGKAAHDVGTFLLAAGAALTQWLAPGAADAVGAAGNAAMWAMIAGVVGYSFYRAWKSDTSIVDWVKAAVRTVLDRDARTHA